MDNFGSGHKGSTGPMETITQSFYKSKSYRYFLP